MNKRIFTKKLMQIFRNEASNGENEEVGSIDCFMFNGKKYSVLKSGKNTFELFQEDVFAPICSLNGGNK